MKRDLDNNSERGTAIVEFALTAAFFLMMIMAIVSGGHLFFTHNAMVESTRRGARYAANQCKPNAPGCPDSATTIERVKNVVLYGTPTAGTTTLVNNLQPSNITVTFSPDYGVAQGTVSVKIENTGVPLNSPQRYYRYTFAVAATLIKMPIYQTTVTGENAGYMPDLACE